ncbi:hypothetical protein CB1_000279012 [Camelus ferus]|nr:hypothetical protein CB1_000279012 [Camelus ferus]
MGAAGRRLPSTGHPRFFALWKRPVPIPEGLGQQASGSWSGCRCAFCPLLSKTRVKSSKQESMLADSFTLVPVLTQWVVYAIRNLTEDNSQNQDLIAKMEEQGLADTSLLKKMGFEVEKRGDKLTLKPTRDMPQLVSMPRRGVAPFRFVESGPHPPITLDVMRFLHENMDGVCCLL